ncbi:hypothetical protein DOY81_002028 [Sarcophaga bullata]|nr:hypothetical protein DOY81_002028 [Sarcophaga bullata]
MYVCIWRCAATEQSVYGESNPQQFCFKLAYWVHDLNCGLCLV